MVFARVQAGYAVHMSDSQPSETKPGPPNPQAEGVEAATPPGGPLRQDDKGVGGGANESNRSQRGDGGHDDDASASRANDKHAEEAGGHTIPLEDEQPGPQRDAQRDPQADHEESDLQAENAETSLDQPSEG